MEGGKTSYLPISVNMAGVIPVIFASALIYMPSQLQMFFSPESDAGAVVGNIAKFFSPNFREWEGWIGALLYMALIFFFTYFWNAMMYNVEDIANNLKKSGSYIPDVEDDSTAAALDRVWEADPVTFLGSCAPQRTGPQAIHFHKRAAS